MSQLDPMNMPAEALAQAETQMLAAVRQLAAAGDGWVSPRDLHDSLYEQGWPFPDPNYISRGLIDTGRLESEFREDGEGTSAPFFRAARGSTPVVPGVRARQSSLAT